MVENDHEKNVGREQSGNGRIVESGGVLRRFQVFLRIREFGSVLRRYWDLLRLGIVSLLVSWTLHPIWEVVRSTDWMRFGGEEGSPWKWLGAAFPAIATLVVISGVLWQILIGYGGWGWTGSWWRRSWKNLPVWIVGVVLAAVHVLVRARFGSLKIYAIQEIATAFLWIFLPFLAIGFLLSLVTRISSYLYSRKAKKGGPEKADSSLRFKGLPVTPEQIVEWVKNDDPVDNMKDDRLDRAPMVKRIAERLRREEPVTIALVGAFGSGKSSVLRMVEKELKESEGDCSVVPCFVSCWGMKEGSASQRILDDAIQAVSEHADCVGLMRLPANYQKALSSAGGNWMDALLSLTHPSKDPEDLLRPLDTLCLRAGLRLAIFIEDIDRNVDTEPLQREVASLLCRVKGLRAITFVYAVGEKHLDKEVLPKIAEHVERLPRMKMDQSARIVEVLYGSYLESFEREDLIDPLGPHRKERRRERHEEIIRELTDIESRYFSLYGIEKPLRLSDSLIYLIFTPRTLKFALRRFVDTWEALWGEVDIDDLLVLCVIREVAPEAFGFIVQSLGSYRVSRKEMKEGVSQGWGTSLREKWEHAIENVEWDKEVVWNLVCFLFPNLLDHNAFFRMTNSPQNFSCESPTDYFERVLAEEIPNGELRDQTVLRAIQSWKQNPSASVHDGRTLPAAILLIEGFAKKVEQFGCFLKGKEIRKIASSLFEIIQQGKPEGMDSPPHETRGDLSGNSESLNRPMGNPMKGVEWKDQFNQIWESYPPGFQEMLYLSKNNPNSDDHRDWLMEEIKKALPDSLRFAIELYRWGGRISENTVIPGLHNFLWETARTAFDDNSERLLKVLEAEQRVGLRETVFHDIVQLVNGFDGEGVDWTADWSWLGNVLLDALPLNRKVILPRIAAIAKSCPVTREESPEFRNEVRDLMKTVFGEKTDDALRELVAGPGDKTGLSEEAREILGEAKGLAEGRLNQPPPSERSSPKGDDLSGSR